MARHLLIGDGTTSAMANGVEAAGAINVQKLSATGPVDLVAGDSVADSDQIRFLQGTADKNIVSPWIYGRNVINWSGKSYVADAAHRVDGTLTTSTAVTGTVTTKIFRTDSPNFEYYSFDTDYTTAVQTPTQIQVLVLAAWDAIAAADKPDWLNDTASVNAGAFRVTASKRGDTTNSGAIWDEKNPIIDMIQTHSADTAQTFASAVGVAMTPGYGGGYYVQDFEGDLQGINYGYYNRVQQPIAPALTAVVGSTYDMYSIVASKDGSTTSGINGVDNLIEINIAIPAGDADGVLFENKVNGYMASVDFAPVTL